METVFLKIQNKKLKAPSALTMQRIGMDKFEFRIKQQELEQSMRRDEIRLEIDRRQEREYNIRKHSNEELSLCIQCMQCFLCFTLLVR